MAKKELMIDNTPYEWGKPKISEPELRTLGSIPDGVHIFYQRPGKPDLEVKPETVVDLAATPGIDKFSTESVNSGAGSNGAFA